MESSKLTQSNQRLQAVRLGLTVGLAMLFLVVLLGGLRGVNPVRADPGILYVDGATGQNIGACGTTSTPCRTIYYALDSRAVDGDTVRIAQGVYTENLTVDFQITLEGGYESISWTRNITQHKTIIDGFNSRTVPGDWDGSGVHTSVVISDDGMYKMWYHGWNLTSQGIGLATSSDGIAWIKHTSNPVLTATEEWEDGPLSHPYVIKDGTEYKMWYGLNDDKVVYAWSSDGIHWTKYADNHILEGSPGAWDENGVGAPFVIKVGSNDYRMWYQSKYPGIGYATSTDGITWTKYVSPVLVPGPSGAWDGEWVADPNVLFDGMTYHMWYAATHEEDVFRIGYASSSDGIHWNKSASNPLFSFGAPGEWDEGGVSEPNVLFDGVLYRMWFSGWQYGWQTVQRGYATSLNGVNWTKYANNPVLSPGTPGQWGQPVVAFTSGSDGSVLDGVTVRNGEAEYGGGVFIDGVQVTVQDCVVTGNNAYYGGGGIDVAWGARATIRNTRVLSNSVSRHFGGGILVRGVDAQADIRDSLVAGNRGAEWGGNGITLDYYASATLVNDEIVSNTCPAGDDGGGVRVHNHSSAEIRDSLITDNLTNGGGGGIAVTYHSTATISSNQILSNTARWGGGGVTISDLCTATITSNEILSNVSEYGGGGIEVTYDSAATIVGNQVFSNTAPGCGGGIRIGSNSVATATHNQILSNIVTAGGGGGICVIDFSSASVDGNAVTNNTVNGGGGGVAIGNGSAATVTNNVVALNSGLDSDGIVVWGGSDSDVQINNNTIVSNTAEGIQADVGTVVIRNNILYGNNGGIHNYQSGATVSSDHNAFWSNGWDYLNIISGTGDISADPLFVDTAGEDFHIRFGSPAMNAGTNVGAPAYDKDGVPRPQMGIVDMGAYEVVALLPPTDLCARPGLDSIMLDWTPSPSTDLVGYNIYRSTSPSSGFSQINPSLVTGDHYTDNEPALIKGTTYYYYLKSVDRSSQESEPSNTASATVGQLELWIPDLRGPHGVTTTVPINIANATGLSIGALDVYLMYTPTVLSGVDVRPTILTQDYGFALNVTQPGVVRIALATGAIPTSLYGSGTLFQVIFDVLGNEGEVSRLVFDASNTDVYDIGDLYNLIPLALTNGSFTVSPSYVLGDLNGDGKVNAADATLALFIAVGRISPTPEQRIAGDVNGDGRINGADATMILRMAAELPMLPSGSVPQPTDAVALSIASVTGEIGDQVSVPVSIDDAIGVAGGRLSINYDSTKLKAVKTSLTSLTSGFTMAVYTDTLGVVNLSFSPLAGNEEGLSGGSGALVQLDFLIEGTGVQESGSALAASGDAATITLAAGELNDAYGRDFATSALQAPVNLSGGEVRIAKPRLFLPLVLRNH